MGYNEEKKRIEVNRTHAEESVEERYTREKEDRMTEKQDGKMRANETGIVRPGKERAKRRTRQCGEGRSAVIPANLHDAKIHGKRRTLVNVLQV